MSPTRLIRILAVAAALVGAAFTAALLGGSLQKHMLAHVLLVDVVAASLVLLMPIDARQRFSRRVDDAARRSGAHAVLARLVRSPLVLLGLWTIVLTWLMSPAGHTRVTTGGAPIVEAFVLLGIGIAFWRATFDQHSPRPFASALVHGGLRWWGRHAFAMVGRIAILPAILILWYAPSGSYVGANAADQIEAASIVLGAEMMIFGAAAMLFLILFVRDDSQRSAAHGI